jgi:hypothetical protein
VGIQGFDHRVPPDGNIVDNSSRSRRLGIGRWVQEVCHPEKLWQSIEKIDEFKKCRDSAAARYLAAA